MAKIRETAPAKAKSASKAKQKASPKVPLRRSPRKAAQSEEESGVDEITVASPKPAKKGASGKKSAASKDVLASRRATKVTKPRTPSAKSPAEKKLAVSKAKSPASESARPRGRPRAETTKTSTASKAAKNDEPIVAAAPDEDVEWTDSPKKGTAKRRAGETKAPSKNPSRSPSKSPGRPKTRNSPANAATGSTRTRSKSPAKPNAPTGRKSKSPARKAVNQKARSRSRSPEKTSPSKQSSTRQGSTREILDFSSGPTRRSGARTEKSPIRGRPAFIPPAQGMRFEDEPEAGPSRTHQGPANSSPKRKLSKNQSPGPGPSKDKNQPLAAGQPSAPGRGAVHSAANPEFTEDASGTAKRNPFFETMPGPEVWHRRMPRFFPFGETPFMEQVMSREINEDLAKGQEQANSRAASSGGLLGRATSAVKNAVFPKVLPAKATPYPSPWELPEVDESEVEQALKEMQETARSSKSVNANKRKISGDGAATSRKRPNKSSDVLMSGAVVP